MKIALRTLAVAVLLGALNAQAQELFVYDNTDVNMSMPVLNGGAAVQSGNTITRLIADDITPLPGYAGINIDRIYFGVYNGNTAPVSARARLRFYQSDGAGGNPGTLITGFSFNPINFNSGFSGFYFNPANMPLPGGTFWVGLTFDNNTGGTGATVAQMDNLGLALFNPPSVGTSTDNLFRTDTAGSWFSSNPSGSLFNFNGNPPANAFFAFSVVPEPTVMTLSALGLALAVIMRRRK